LKALRSFKERDFRLFFSGQFVSMTGTWMQMTAQVWLVYRLTESSFMLGLTGFAGQVPVLLFALFGGALADRCDRRRLLLWTQAFSLLQATLLAVLTLSGTVQISHILALAFMLGTINAFDVPARQSFLVEIVEHEDLPNAIALNSTLVNSSRMVGPALAGWLIEGWGEGACFALNAASFLAVLWSLWAIRPRPSRPRQHEPALDSIRRGLSYAASHPRMRAALLLVAGVSLFGMPYNLLLPVFAKEVLHGGAQTLGWLAAATGLGAVAGALSLARREGTAGLERTIGLSAVGFGLGLGLFSRAQSLPAALLLMAACGWAVMHVIAGTNTLLQSLTSDEMRGRVMSLFTMVFFGMFPFGSLLIGAAAKRFGAPSAVLGAGLACMACGAWHLAAEKEAPQG